jgi:hypothetical protein
VAELERFHHPERRFTLLTDLSTDAQLRHHCGLVLLRTCALPPFFVRLGNVLSVAVALGCSGGGSDEPPAPNAAGGNPPSAGGAPSTSGGVQNGGRSSGTGGTSTPGGSGLGGAAGENGTAGGSAALPTAGSPSNGSAGSRASGGSSNQGGSGAQGGSAGITAAIGGAPSGGRDAGAGNSSGGRAGTSGAGGTPNAGGMAGGSGSIDTKNVTVTCPGAVPAGITSVWCSCDQWGEKTSGSDTYYNDIWGSGPGPQCIWLGDSGAWGLASQHPTTSGIKSYPNVSLSPQKAISSFNTYTSSFEVIVPNGGAYETAYDLWVKGATSARIEIMLWMTYRGGVQPIAKAYDGSGAVADVTNVTVGGHTWNVYYGSNGANDVASFLRTSTTSSGTVDIKAILAWLIANNTSSYAKFDASYTLDQVQFGHEITSDGATQAYVTKSFSVTSN